MQTGTLREALNFANLKSATAPGDFTTITVSPSLSGQIIYLQGNLPLVATSTTITGNGVVLDGRSSAMGAATYRGFLVTGVATTPDGTPPAITVNISGLKIQYVLAHGGNAPGTAPNGGHYLDGGGGLGAGGAVFVGENAKVTLTGVNVSNATAQGGTGGNGTGGEGGVGGGLSGNGGGDSNGGGGGILFAGGAQNGGDFGGGGITSVGGDGQKGRGGNGGLGLSGFGGGGGGGSVGSQGQGGI